MKIVISYPPGFNVDGIVLWAGHRTLRVAMRNWDDAAVFHVREGRWTAENGDAVEIRYRQSAAAPAIPASAA